MPIIFAQPQPVGGFSRLADMQGRITPRDNLAAAVSMNNALQGRFASDYQTESRAGLGYAQMYADYGARMAALGVQSEGQRIQAATAQNIAAQRAATDMWSLNQQMTASDNRKLNQDRVAVAELQQLHQKGMLSDEEYYGSITKLKSGIDILAMKEQSTKNEMLNNMRQEQAEKIKAEKEHRQFLNKWDRGELEQSTEYVMMPGAEEKLAEDMRFAYPELQPGTPAYQEQMKKEAAKVGLATAAIRYNGKLVPVSDLFGKQGGQQNMSGNAITTGQPSAKESAMMSETQHADMAAKALEMARSDKKDDASIDLKTRAAEYMGFLQEQIGARRDVLSGKEQMSKAKEDANFAKTTIDNALKDLSQRPDLAPMAGKISYNLIKAKEILNHYGIEANIPPSVRPRYEKYLRSVKLPPLAQESQAERMKAATEGFSAAQKAFGSMFGDGEGRRQSQWDSAGTSGR